MPQLQVRDVIWRVNIGSCKPVAAPWDSSDHGKWGGESRFCCTGKRVGRGNTIPPLSGAPVPWLSPVVGTFLTCEVKCGAAALDIANRQNAQSMTLAVRAIVELFRVLKREDEVHQQVLAFSISHDHSSVRIYGHYPVIAGKHIKYYRHPIYKFDFTALDGRDKWTAYRCTKNVYVIWMPAHFKNICSAIDQLPSNLDFDVPPPSEDTDLSQYLGNLMQSNAGSVSVPVEQDSQSITAEQQGVTPGTSFTMPGPVKRRKS